MQASRGVNRITAQTAEYRQELPEDREGEQQPNEWNCTECSYQTNAEKRLDSHVKDIHRITCFTSQQKFKTFSEMINHRRVNHPINKKCIKFPACERGDRCLYRHEGSNETGGTQENQESGDIVICRTCKTENKDKNDIMVHRKLEHLSEVKICMNFNEGLNCRKGSDMCWYKHEQTEMNPRNTSRNSINTTAFNLQNFPNGPTPQGAGVGQYKMDLQMIQQTLLTQQQQMMEMMREIMNLKK